MIFYIFITRFGEMEHLGKEILFYGSDNLISISGHKFSIFIFIVCCTLEGNFKEIESLWDFGLG